MTRKACLLVFVALGLPSCDHPSSPAHLPPEQAAGIRIHRDETDLNAFGVTFGLGVEIYDSADACPEPGFRGYRMQRQLGSLELSKGESAEFTVPANRWIFLGLQEDEMSIGLSSSCRLTVGWIPAAGHRYEIDFTTQGYTCRIQGTDATTGEQVAFTTPKECAESEEPR